jgi:hypothetical protein
MLAGLYINEFWGGLLLMTIAVGPVVAMMTLVDWLYRLDDARLQAVRQREAAAHKPASPRHARDAASAGTYSYNFEKAPTRPSAKASPQPARKDGEQTGRETSPPAKGTEPKRAWSWEDARDEEFYSRLRMEAWSRKEVLDAVINKWRSKHGFPAFGIADPAKASLLERYILMLSFEEQAVVILEYGLLDGRRLSPVQTAIALMRSAEAISRFEQTALWKIDALHKHAEAQDLLGLMWVYEKKAWIHHRYTEAERRALRREGDTKYRALANVEKRARQWLEIQTEPARKRETVNADRRLIPACGLIETWQIVRGLKRRNYSRQAMLKANDVVKCLALLEAAQSPVARGAWLTQLVRYNPDLKQKHIDATGAVKPVATRHREWTTIEAIENASETEWLLGNVSAHQRLVLELAFGITTPGCFSDEEIAQLMDVSLEEVTEMKLYALEKMRSLAARQKGRINR